MFRTSLSAVLRRLTGLEWLAVALPAPFLLFPSVRPFLTAVSLIVLAALWLLRWVVRREPFPASVGRPWAVKENGTNGESAIRVIRGKRLFGSGLSGLGHQERGVDARPSAFALYGGQGIMALQKAGMPSR